MNKEINIVYKKIDEIIPYENNPRINEASIDAVANSIDEFGFKVPIVLDKNNVIITGHTRLLASKKLGLEKVPCIYAEDLTDEQVKAYRIADNKVGENSEWDFSKLKKELDAIKDIDMSDFNIDMDEINSQIAAMKKATTEAKEDDFDVDAEIEKIEEPKSKSGDIYILGNHRLMCGDSTKEEDVKKLMNNTKADMVFTDPPYGVNYEGINNDDRSGLENLLDKSFQNFKNFSNNGSSIYCFHSDKCADIFHKIFRKYCHFSSMIIWEKQSLVLSQGDYQSIHEPCLYGWFNNGTHKFYGDRKQTSVWACDRKRFNGHSTPKPIDFITKALNNSSLENNIVLDLFGGSGSTLISCEQLNRKCYMMELDPKYIDVIIKRWEEFTGKKAEKL